MRMMPLGGFADKDALLGDEDCDSQGSSQNEAAWICNGPEDNARLWMHRMPVFEGRCCFMTEIKRLALEALKIKSFVFDESALRAFQHR